MSHLPRSELSVVTRVVASSGLAADVVHAFVDPYTKALFVIVADGAGNSDRGAKAAAVVMREAARVLVPDTDLLELLTRIDQTVAMTGGETTAVALIVSGGIVRGASVGDSEAWLIGDDWMRLTEGQRRKPLLGSGDAKPIPFRAELRGTLIVGTDGLFKYGEVSAITSAAKNPDLERVADELVAAVRLPSGALQDDVGLAAIRQAPRP